MYSQLTGISVLEADLARAEGTVDDGNELVIEVLSAGEEIGVFRGGEVLVGAAYSRSASRSSLKPAIVFAARTAGSESQGNQLVSIERCCDI